MKLPRRRHVLSVFPVLHGDEATEVHTVNSSKLLAAILAVTLALPGAGLAAPWKDESGHGRGHHRAERWDGRSDRGGWDRGGWDRADRDRRHWDHQDRDRRGRDRRDRAWHDRRYGGESRRDHWGYAQPWVLPGHLSPPGGYRAWY